MVEKDVYCTDILVQAAAARSALNGFTRELGLHTILEKYQPVG